MADPAVALDILLALRLTLVSTQRMVRWRQRRAMVDQHKHRSEKLSVEESWVGLSSVHEGDRTHGMGVRTEKAPLAPYSAPC